MKIKVQVSDKSQATDRTREEKREERKATRRASGFSSRGSIGGSRIVESSGVACGGAWDSSFIWLGQSVERHRCARARSNNKS